MVTPVPAKRGKKPRGTPAAPPASGQVQSLQRGLHLLELIADSHGSVALTELAQQAGLPNSTTHRLLTTMQQQGFVHQTGDLGLWTIGAHAFVVGSSFLQSRNLLALVHPVLRTLMETSGETVNLAVLDLSDYQAVISPGDYHRPGAVHAADAHVRADWRQAADARLRRGQGFSGAPER